jgi:hypothetical protein
MSSGGLEIRAEVSIPAIGILILFMLLVAGIRMFITLNV